MAPNEKTAVHQVALDTSTFKDAIAQLRKDVQGLHSLLEKTISIKIDIKQFDRLNDTLRSGFTKLGQQVKGVMQMASDESIAALGQINATLEKMGTTGGVRFGEKIAEGVGRGVKQGSQKVTDAVAKEVDDALERAADGIDRFEDRVNAAVARNAAAIRRLSSEGQAAFNGIAGRAGISNNRDFLVRNDDKGDYLSSSRQQQFAQALEAASKYQQTLAEVEKTHGKAIEMAKQEQIAVEKAQAAANKMLQKEGAAAQAAVQREQNALTRDTNKYLNDTLGSHKGILNTLVQNVAQAAKWFVIYTTIYGTVRQIQTALEGMLSRGVEYAANLETQQLGLRGILAENFKITDQQGRQLDGATAMAVLQASAAQQWKQIQAASLSVVGTTEDLMLLYSGILPFAAKLGKGLEEVQQMTKSAAVAASLLGVSFNDARSAMIAMLQGRALTRNKLVGILGFSADDLAGLKGTPELFDKIQGKLQQFLALSGEAQKTIAANAETIKDLSGIVGFAFVQPLTESFAKFVQMMTNVIYQVDAAGQTTGEFAPQFKAFLTTVTYSVEQLLVPLKELGRDLLVQAGTDLPTWINGVLNMVRPLITVAGLFAKGAIAVADFVSKNYLFLQVMISLGALFAGAQWLFTLPGQLNKAAQGASLFGQALAKLVGPLTAVGPAATAAETGTLAFGRSIQLLAGATIIGAATGALVFMIQKLTHWISVASSAKELARNIANGETIGAITDAEPLLSDSNTSRNAQGAQGLVAAAKNAFAELSKIGADTSEKILAKNRAWADQLAGINQQLEEIGNKEAKLGKGQQLSDTDKAKREELLRELAQLKDAPAQVSAKLDDVQAIAAQAQRLRNIAKKIQTEVGFNSNLVRQPDGSYKKSLSTTDQANVQTILAAAAELEKQLAQAKVLQQAQAQQGAQNVTLTPVRDVDAPKQKRPALVDSFNELVQMKRAQLELLEERDKLAVAQGDMLQDEAQKRQEQREVELTDFIEAQLVVRQKNFEDWAKRMEAYKKGKTSDQKDDIDAEVAKAGADIQRDAEVAKANSEKATLALKRGGATRSKAFADAMQQYQDGIEAKENEVFFRTGEQAVSQFQRVIDQIEALRPTDTAGQDAKAALVARAKALQDAIKQRAENDRSLKLDDRNINSYIDQEKLLHQQFENNRVGVAAYAKELLRLRDAQKDALLQKQGDLTQRKSMILAGGGDASELENVNAQLQDVQSRLDLINSTSEKIRDTFSAWAGVLSSFSQYTSLFGDMNKSIAGFGNSISDIISKSGSFVTMLDKVKAFSGALAVLKGGGGSITTTVLDDGSIIKVSESVGKATKSIGAFFGAIGGAQAGEAATGLQKSMGALAVAGAAAGVGIGIATALFQRAVEKAKKNISDSFKAISDSIKEGARDSENGVTQWGEALARMEKARQDAIKKYSQSKSGRAALKDLLPDIDSQIDDVKQKVDDIRKSFEEKLKETRLGSGPFADFAKMLYDLEQATSQYLGTFVKGTKEYGEALNNIRELYNLTLRDAKRNLQEQMTGFELDAISAMENVISLLDQQTDLYDQLADIADKRKELEDERQQLEQDKAEAAAELEQERLDNTKKILELEKQIRDVIRKAADDEANIRRRGVLEAQATIAQQKARDISNVRYDASDQVRQLRDQIAQLSNQEALAKKVKDTNKQFQDRSAELDKQLNALNKQAATIDQQLHLNDIQLTYARAIADVEGNVFGLELDRYALADRRGQLELSQAQSKVAQWQQVQSLIDSIVESGDGVLFNPPPGFPQVRVQIGDININNSDNSVNSTAVNNPPGQQYDPADYNHDGKVDHGEAVWHKGDPNRTMGTQDEVSHGDLVRQYGEY